MTVENPPEYRLRLFLSVDLVGSTAYKSKEGNTNIQWIKAFQKFYGEFPNQLSKKYKEICEKTPEISKDELSSTPKVWKTIGDEIIFVNRVNSITHIGAYIRAFGETLIEFGSEVQASFELNTKGNAWIAAFPNPNRSIRLSINGSDPLIGENDVLTEEFEAAVDENPSNYDFLGKGIDSGFRISRNSTTEALTISPALAYLLCKAKRNVDTTKFDERFVFHEPQEFKGVVKGQRYPVISLITSRNAQIDTLQNLESELLNRPREADFLKLYNYLENYISHHRIEKPELKLTSGSSSVDAPEHYTQYIEAWREDLEQINSAKSFEDSALLSSNNEEDRTQDNQKVDFKSFEATLIKFINSAAALANKNTLNTLQKPDDNQEG